MKLAVVGATGLVGQTLLRVLEERNFPITEFLVVASARSVGKKIVFRGSEHTVISMTDAIAARPDIAIFSAGGSVSEEFAPQFAAVGTTVIDNSSAFRMNPSNKLVVSEVNANVLTIHDKIIANPNCTTMQLLVALAPLHRKYGIERLVVSTYQSITGTGARAVTQYEQEMAGTPQNEVAMVYPHPIFANVIPQCDSFTDNGYTKEEMKVVNETRKILGDDAIKITCTAVRVPVWGGHSESVNVTLRQEYDIADVFALLRNAEGLTVLDNPAAHEYPMPLTAYGQDGTWVGRIRRDDSAPRSLNMWVVADNLRKGAATNTVQIAEYLVANGLLSNS
jgi:aspartate-semialdehyde dehydrogenase